MLSEGIQKDSRCFSEVVAWFHVYSCVADECSFVILNTNARKCFLMFMLVFCLCKQQLLAVDFKLTFLLPFKSSDIICRRFKVVPAVPAAQAALRYRRHAQRCKYFTCSLIFQIYRGMYSPCVLLNSKPNTFGICQCFK